MNSHYETTVRATELAFDLLQSYPEVSSEWIRCVEWSGYNVPNCTAYALQFNYIEGEVMCHQWVNTDDMVRAVLGMYNMVKGGRLRVVSLAHFWEADEWDAIAIDCLMQIHFYGNVIYG